MSIQFSIIIPTYNRAHLLENSIQSVLNQAFHNYELIIVDDGSTDNTNQVVSKIINANPTKQIHYYKIENSERAAARNFGLSKSKGDYINYFDSDDELYANHLQTALAFLIEKDFPEIIALHYHIKNDQNNKIKLCPKLKSPVNAKLITGNFLCCHSVFINKEIAKLNLFNEERDLSGLEDWELWLRLAAQYPIHYSNTITSAFINHKERSVLEINKEKLIKRTEKLILLIESNRKITSYFSSLKNFKLSCYSYVSLHLALNKIYKKDALHYLFKSLWIQPLFVFKKRFYAILKHLF